VEVADGEAEHVAVARGRDAAVFAGREDLADDEAGLVRGEREAVALGERGDDEGDGLVGRQHAARARATARKISANSAGLGPVTSIL